MKKMSGLAIFGIVSLVIVLLVGMWSIGSYNSLVSLRENVASKSSNIDVQLQRRMDLIPNLVNTVKGYTTHESDILTKISESRSKLSGAKTIQEKANADSELTSSLNRLLMVVENYPELKADTQFTALSDELAGTENRISTARKDYNDAVQIYNNKVKGFPGVIIASMFGFTAADRFEANESAKEVPTVNFN